jgi:hypothetical protein
MTKVSPETSTISYALPDVQVLQFWETPTCLAIHLLIAHRTETVEGDEYNIDRAGW